MGTGSAEDVSQVLKAGIQLDMKNHPDVWAPVLDAWDQILALPEEERKQVIHEIAQRIVLLSPEVA